MKRTVEVKIVEIYKIPVVGKDYDDIGNNIVKMFENGEFNKFPCLCKIDKMKIRK